MVRFGIYVLIFVRLGTLDDIWVLIWFQGGLFAAFLSAFFAFLIPQPQPSSANVAMDVCVHSLQQLSSSTAPAFVPTSSSLLQCSRGEHALLPQPCTRFDRYIPRHAREMLTAGVWPWID